MKIAITGAGGLVGTAFTKLHSDYTYRFISRSKSSNEKVITWNPQEQLINAEELEGLDAVIHLAGESIVALRWTDAKKQAIRESRVLGTRLLVNTLRALKKPPKVVLSASAIGYYGQTTSSGAATEQTPAGSGFLADVCVDWEKELEELKTSDIRLLTLRIGLVLAREGGAFPMMLPAFKLGLGGVVGSGEQMMSWITLRDLVRSISFLVHGDSHTGVFNAVAPNAVSNRAFTKALGEKLSRPTLLPVPAPFVRLGLGEMGESLLLGDTHVLPVRLQQAGFNFEDPDIHAAFSHLL